MTTINLEKATQLFPSLEVPTKPNAEHMELQGMSWDNKSDQALDTIPGQHHRISAKHQECVRLGNC